MFALTLFLQEPGACGLRKHKLRELYSFSNIKLIINRLIQEKKNSGTHLDYP